MMVEKNRLNSKECMAKSRKGYENCMKTEFDKGKNCDRKLDLAHRIIFDCYDSIMKIIFGFLYVCASLAAVSAALPHPSCDLCFSTAQFAFLTLYTITI